ncbi:MAG: TlyA family RNA methyltransferase [Syntrophomonadaceae bacterium]
MGKIRLDLLIYTKGMAASREKARAMILAGEVRIDGHLADKPGLRVEETADVTVESRKGKYVSRGGFKLQQAIKDFRVDFHGKVVLDVGASTGGYTDCALQNGARRVYALDVGYGQLDWSLRNDERVRVMERTNIRYVTLNDLGEKVDIITMDVSFISTRLIFPVLYDLLQEDGEVISLIKPQFEAGKDKVGKKGVVRDPAVHQEVLTQCIAAAAAVDLVCVDISYSPIKGPQGNIEYFIHLKKRGEPIDSLATKVVGIVSEAHRILED